MKREDIIYLTLLLVCIPFGHVVKSVNSPHVKQFLTLAVGLIVALSTAGFEGIWHSALTILGNFILVKLVGLQYCTLASFLFVFGYLFFFRTCTWYGFPTPPSHCNAIQLLVTIRMIGLAFEYRQSHLNAKKDNEDDESSPLVAKEVKLWSSPINPSLYDYYSYAYCYCGLMTGPYYTYRTYVHMLHQDGSKISTVWPALRKVRSLPAFAVPYLLLQAYFPDHHIGTDAYLNHPWGLAHRILYLVPCFTWFRYRFYIGWMLAEAMCITMGLGAYPFESEPKPGIGPTKPYTYQRDKDVAPRNNGDTHSFGTVQNIDIFDVEFSSSVRHAMKSWNKTVQWWLANYVHRQIPFKQFRMAIVLFTSAFWHGVHPGYYVTFMSVPLMIFCDNQVCMLARSYLTSAKQLYYFEWVRWFCLYRVYEYLSVGFIMLKLDVVWKVYKQNYFIGHILMVIFSIIPFFLPKKKPKMKDVAASKDFVDREEKIFTGKDGPKGKME